MRAEGTLRALVDKDVDLDENAMNRPFSPRDIISKPLKNLTALRQQVAICWISEEIEHRSPGEAIIDHIRPKIAEAHLNIVGSPYMGDGPVPIEYTFAEMGNDIAKRLAA